MSCIMSPVRRSFSGHGVAPPALVMKGIFIHPDHLQEVSSEYSSGYTPGYTSGYTTQNIKTQLESMEIDSPLESSPYSSFYSDSSLSSQTSENSNSDYFSQQRPRPASRKNSFQLYPIDTNTLDSTPTATPEPIGLFPASFQFSAFSASTPLSAPIRPPTVSSSGMSRASPYNKMGGSSMLRAVSSPVETQRELDARRKLQNSANKVLEQQATKLIRSQSVANIATMTSSSSSAASSSLPLRSPLITPFAQPSPELAAAGCFPENLARTNSVTNLTSPRVRRGTLLTPLTPIVPANDFQQFESFEAFENQVEKNNLATQETNSPKSLSSRKFTRKMTF